jgi:OOP family OmpA-OmpF porin
LRLLRIAVLTATLCIGGYCIAAAQIVSPDAPADLDALCARAFADHNPGPVNFDESTTTFRSSAVPVLQRIVALANTCRNAAIEITGHTDSSGDERWNVRLSLARAEAIADYLVQQGIAAERLIATGAGSALPIADNSTRYGRGLNRRIEFTFIPGDEAAPNRQRPPPGPSD